MFSRARRKTLSGDSVVFDDYEFLLDGSRVIAQKKANVGTMWFYYDANGKRLGFTDYNGIPYYYIYNAMGDVIGMYDQYGDVIYYHYDSWGKLVSITNVLGEEITYGSAKWTIAQENPFRYRGYMYDNTTRLYYLNSRYYDPETGRFINGDVLLTVGGHVLGTNLYAYCFNNPVNLCDPSGCYPLLGYGSTGSDVRNLQTMLNANGYNLAVDGIFGQKTKAAVRDYQAANGLKVDGLVGDETWGSLYRARGDGTTISAATGNVYYIYEQYEIQFTVSNYNISVDMNQRGVHLLMRSNIGEIYVFIDFLMLTYQNKYRHSMPRTAMRMFNELVFHYKLRNISGRAATCDFDTYEHQGNQNWQIFEQKLFWW